MARDTKASTELEKAGDRQPGIAAAFQSVTDGVLDLAKTHLELAKAEARQDIKLYGSDAVQGLVGLGLALLGLGIANLAVICFAGWVGGLAAMAGTSAVLGIVYTVGGLRMARTATERMQAREGALSQTKNEIKRSTEWVKEIRETS